MILRIEIYFPLLVEQFTKMFFGCNNLLITSNTVVLRTLDCTLLSIIIGVYPVIRKWHLGVGISEATNPIKSLFMYPGYLKVVVDADIIVDTTAFCFS